MRTTPAHARRTDRFAGTGEPRLLLSVVALLLLALGIGVYLLPPSFGGVALNEAGDPRPYGADATSASATLGSPVGTTPPGQVPVSGPVSPTRSASRSATPTARHTTKASTTAGLRQSSTSPASGDTALEDQVTALVNQERGEAGCAPLRTDEKLRAAARGHSRDMATNDYFDHTSRDGRSFVDRIANAGYPRAQAGGENIAMGYRTPADVMSGWMNSEGHRANILNCGFKAIGVGLGHAANGTLYWTQDFGRA